MVSWDKSISGGVSQSVVKWARLSLLFVVLFSPLLALLIDFVPSKSAYFVGTLLALFFSIIGATFVARKGYGLAALPHSNSKKKILSRWLAVIIVYFGFPWFFLVHAFPVSITYFFGDDIELTGKFIKDEGRGRHSCRYKLKGDLLKGSFSGYLCVNSGLYNADVSIYTLRGKESFAGKLYLDVSAKLN